MALMTVQDVTPCVGVWIETRIPAIPFRFTSVTPCVGVWIETGGLPQLLEAAESHPAWVCGLKQLERGTIATDWKSHPAWVCGLKPSTVNLTIPCFGHTLRGCVD